MVMQKTPRRQIIELPGQTDNQICLEKYKIGRQIKVRAGWIYYPHTIYSYSY